MVILAVGFTAQIFASFPLAIAVPEIDAGSMVAGVTLLAGGLALLMERRWRK